KKQWTWGNHEFGYAWDRNLTDPDENGEYRPYIELMGGVYTDNQPDFSFLQPGETRTWSQFWYPIRMIGPAQKANPDGALGLSVRRGIAHIGVAVTARQPDARVQLARGAKVVGEWEHALAPDRPLVFEVAVDASARPEDFTLRVIAGHGGELISYTPSAPAPGRPHTPAKEPAEPALTATADELFITGLHLEQYRHATRLPEAYWREALRRDPGDSRCNLALGRWHLRRGELDDAERYLRAAIARLLERNPNPYDGEAHYQLGICLRHQATAEGGDSAALDAAYDAFFKATWSLAWQPAGFHALAEIDSLRGDWPRALEHADRALRVNADNLRARDLKAIILRKLGRKAEAATLIRETLATDPLDWWARHLAGEELGCDTQVRLDLALDYSGAGQFQDALDVLSGAPGTKKRISASGGIPPADLPDATLGTEPLVHYYRAWTCHRMGNRKAERQHLSAASRAGGDYCFPARLEEIAILRHAIASNSRDARAPFYLGNLLYDRRRHREAIEMWELAAKLEPRNAIAWRNLGIGYFNILGRPADARAAYERALAANPHDGRLVYERDQLWKRQGVPPAKRLRQLRRHAALVRSRDDLSVEICALYNQTGAPDGALRIVATRKFQPWEGGEGLALRQHVRTHIALGRRALSRRQTSSALLHFGAALSAPENLGEAHHLLANQSDSHFWMGKALKESGDLKGAKRHWETAAAAR
ncbi:MAG TPA: tetratricopeptide repeat protein, partial [Opitutaceae bacterium]